MKVFSKKPPIQLLAALGVLVSIAAYAQVRGPFGPQGPGRPGPTPFIPGGPNDGRFGPPGRPGGPPIGPWGPPRRPSGPPIPGGPGWGHDDHNHGPNAPWWDHTGEDRWNHHNDNWDHYGPGGYGRVVFGPNGGPGRFRWDSPYVARPWNVRAPYGLGYGFDDFTRPYGNRWGALGSPTYISQGQQDFEVIQVHACGIDQMMIGVNNNDVVIDQVIIEYMDEGLNESVPFQEYFNAGTFSGWRPIPGWGRCIGDIVVVGSTPQNFNGQALVQVYGLRTQ